MTVSETAAHPSSEPLYAALVAELFQAHKDGFHAGFDAGLIYCAHLSEVAPERIRELSLIAASRLLATPEVVTA